MDINFKDAHASNNSLVHFYSGSSGIFFSFFLLWLFVSLFELIVHLHNTYIHIYLG